MVRFHENLRAIVSLVQVRGDGAQDDQRKVTHAVYRIQYEESEGSFGCTCTTGRRGETCIHMAHADHPEWSREILGATMDGVPVVRVIPIPRQSLGDPQHAELRCCPYCGDRHVFELVTRSLAEGAREHHQTICAGYWRPHAGYVLYVPAATAPSRAPVTRTAKRPRRAKGAAA